MSETTEHDHPRVWWKEWSKCLLIKLLFDFGVAGGKPHVRYLPNWDSRTIGLAVL